MIIIKTKQGDIFVNDREMVNVTHNRELHTVEINDGKATGTLWHQPPIKQVENVVYINEQTAQEWKDNGSELEYLRKKMDALKLELRCHKEICNGAKEHLMQLARDCVRWENSYHNDMPDNLAELMRKRGEEEKAYFDEIAGWEHPEKWMQNHQNAEEIEADEVARLNTTIEAQATRICELKTEIERLEANERMRQATTAPTPRRRPWWHRWLNF